jgi:hypothetical protein
MIHDEWLLFAHPPTPRRYFQYPHLLELAPGLIGPGHVVAGRHRAPTRSMSSRARQKHTLHSTIYNGTN